jgi:hypothetical protein
MDRLTMTLQHTPHGVRLIGPDPQRVAYVPVRQNGRNRGQCVWSSDEIRIVVSPAADGVEINVTIYDQKRKAAQAAVRAA